MTTFIELPYPKKQLFTKLIEQLILLSNRNEHKDIIIVIVHMSSFHFVYIDQISFNLEMRPDKGWALDGKQLNATKPTKSKNYSVIVVDGY